MQNREEKDDLARTVRAAQAGDPRAFEALVNRFREPVAAYAWGLLRDRGHAEDAAQEAFLVAYRELGTLREPGSFRSWIYTVVEHIALTGRRRLRRRKTAEIREGEAVAEGGPWTRGPGDEGEEESRPEVLAMREAFERLPKTYAEVLDLHYLQGLSARQIAETLGLRLNNAKVRLHRARNALRRDLAARGVTGRGGAAAAAARPAEATP